MRKVPSQIHVALPPSTEWEVRIADLLEWSVPIAWHEAVALVREVARQVTGGGVPPASQIALGRDGAVTLTARLGSGADTVSGLVELLQLLLPAEAPDGLRKLTEVSIPSGSPQEFINTLTYFARPDDKAELLSLAGKAWAARESTERAAALAALTDRARHAPGVPEPAARPARKSLSVSGLAGAAVLIVGGCGVALGAWWFMGTRAADAAQVTAAPTPAKGVAHRVQSQVASAIAYVTESLAGTGDVAAGRGKDIELPRRRIGIGPKRAVPAASPTEALLPEAPAQPERPREPFAAAHIGALPLNDGASLGLAVAPHGLYSASHPDVIPPALLRAQMPGTPIEGLPRERPGALELTVDEGGQVLSAKLLPASNRHQDRMMVSAAKTWRFAPATRNGQAVSYRLLLPITW